MNNLCAVSWCVAKAVKKGLCPIHCRYGEDFKPQPAETDSKSVCEICDGAGECQGCSGSGECECHCGTVHDCGECDGTGLCHECKEPRGPSLSQPERDYLAWALSEGAAPCPPFFVVTNR